MSDSVGRDNSSKKGLIIVIIVFSVILIILVGVIAFLLGRNTNNTTAPSPESTTEDNNREVTNPSRIVMDEDSAADVMEEMRKDVEEGMFECQMSMTWDFDNGTAESRNAYVANSTNNTYPIYFDVYLQDTNEVIYSSPVIPVGAELKNISLNKDLDPGTYKATVMYSLIRDEESQEVISSAGFVVTINVTN